jgi:REP element-mobilizing transposase RayT
MRKACGQTCKIREKTCPHTPLPSIPTYLITFPCYGSHLPGQAGAIDRNHNVPGTRLPDPRPKLRQSAEASLRQAPFRMGADQRAVTLDAICGVCHTKNWLLLAAQVRSNHVHTVVDADQTPELIMNTFKSYASRALNSLKPSERGRLRWARHGSTRCLWSPEIVDAAMSYVLDKQGEPMACHSSAC